MSARRGRPLTFDRSEVLDRLVFLFWEKGYEATSQADMIARAEISASSLYNAFGNKPDIFDAVLARYNEMSFGLLAPLREGAEGLADVESFLRGIAQHVRSGEGPPGCIMVRTMTEVSGRADAPPTDERTCRYRDQITDALRAAFGRAVSAGELAQSQVDDKVALVIGVYLGALAVAVGSPATGAQMLDSAAGMVAGWRQG